MSTFSSTSLPPIPEFAVDPLSPPLVAEEHGVHPVEQFLDKLVDDAESLVKREPTKTVAVALAAGLLLNVLPTRFIVGSVTAVTVTVLRPALLTLGVIKALELITEKSKTNLH